MITTPLKSSLPSEDAVTTFHSKDTDNTANGKAKADGAITASEQAEHKQLNPFPVEAFPQKMQGIVNELHKQLGLPIDFIAASMLSIASVAVGNTYAVKVNDSWIDTAIIFMAIVGNPGTAKTPAIDLIAAPLKELDNQSYHTYKEQLSAFKAAPDGATKPTLTKYIVNDATPEALASIHECNKRGLLMLQDELAGLFKNFNRYHGGSEQETWLSLYSGQPITIDRKTSDPVRIARPFVSVLGGIQPAVLSRMAGDDRDYNGFIDRFLFALPKDANKQPLKDKQPDVSNAITGWSSIIHRLTSLELTEDNYGNPLPKVLEFNPKAWKVLQEWDKANTDRINDEDEVMAAVLTKIGQYVVRLSLLLQLMAYGTDDAKPESIEPPAVNGAIKLAAYFTNTAERVRNIIGQVNLLDELPEDKRQLYHKLFDQFTTNEAVTIGKPMGKNELYMKRFIANKKLFKRVKHGLYQKI